MSLHHTAYIITCNGCGKPLQDANGPTRVFPHNVGAIQAAREAGWLVNQSGGTDYCPACKTTRLQKK